MHLRDQQIVHKKNMYTRRKQALDYGLEKAGRCKEGEEMEKELQMARDL